MQFLFFGEKKIWTGFKKVYFSHFRSWSKCVQIGQFFWHFGCIFKVFGFLCEGLFGVWKNFEPYFCKFFLCRANFHWCKRLKIKNWNFPSGHTASLRRSSADVFKMSSICNKRTNLRRHIAPLVVQRPWMAHIAIWLATESVNRCLLPVWPDKNRQMSVKVA